MQTRPREILDLKITACVCVCVCVFVARLFKLDVYGLVPQANGNRRELSGRASVSWPDDSPKFQLSTILQPNIFYHLAQFFSSAS